MKLSELLLARPELDTEMEEDDGDFFLDGVYIFRVLEKDALANTALLFVQSSDHTDRIVRIGLISEAYERFRLPNRS